MTQTPPPRVVILIDGDAMAYKSLKAVLDHAGEIGDVIGCTVYANPSSFLPQDIPEVRRVVAPYGRNAADILLALDAMELLLGDDADIFVIATSDGGLAALVDRIQSRGKIAVVASSNTISGDLRRLCPDYVDVSRRSLPLEEAVTEFDLMVIRTLETAAGGRMDICSFGAKFHDLNRVPIKETPHRKWRNYFSSRRDLYSLPDEGQASVIRLLKRERDLSPGEIAAG